LSRHPTADLLIPLADIEAHLTRPELEALAEPILAQTVSVTQSVLRWANLAEGRIAGVFLVGGASRIPLMSTLLFRALGEAPVVIEQPELVVAEGSILAGALTVGVQAPAAPGPATGLLPRIPADAWGSAGPPSVARPGEIPPVRADTPAPPAATASAATASATTASAATAPPATASAATASAATASPAEASAAAAPVSPAPRSASPAPPPAESPAPVSPEPWVGRVKVPGANQPGRVARPAPVAPTRQLPMPAVVEPPVRRPAYRPSAAYPQRASYPQRKVKRRGRVRRAILFLSVTLFLVAVPVVAGVVAYGLAVGEGYLPDAIQERLSSYQPR
jgi:hypothetical protein